LDSTAPEFLQSSVGSNSMTPVVEGYTGNAKAWQPDGIVNNPRFVHQYQQMIYMMQGLDRDPIRGATTSSSMREAPSTVFGISTPGRAAATVSGRQDLDDTASDPEAIVARIGGHTFVMDDGATGADHVDDGTDQLIRLRTAGGHQILMNDTEQVLYIASSTGKQWMEFSNDGSINVYSAAGFNVRTQGVLNLQGDAAVLINSKGAVEINGDAGVSVSTAGSFAVNAMVSASINATGMASLKAGGVCSVGAGGVMNVGSAGITNISGSLTNLTGTAGLGGGIATLASTVSLPDVTLNGQLWTFNTNSQSTICSRAPSHEPWIDPTTNERPTDQFASGGGLLGGLIGAGAGMAASAGAGAAASAASSFFS
jgi:hypothetical protein